MINAKGYDAIKLKNGGKEAHVKMHNAPGALADAQRYMHGACAHAASAPKR